VWSSLYSGFTGHSREIFGGAILLASPLLAVLVALITLGFSRMLTRPLALLTKATRHLATGDYQVQVPSNAPGELGELARHFHKMATQLQQPAAVALSSHFLHGYKVERQCKVTSHNYTYTPLNAENPPSTGIVIPVAKLEAGLTNHKSVPIKSSGTPKRPIGV
jgi:HAMP domain-containing protein